MDASLGDLLPRLFLSMAAVIGVMYLAARVLKNRQFAGPGGVKLTPGAKRKNPIEVVSRQTLGRHASIAVIKAGDKNLVIGITDAQVNVLAELEDADLEEKLDLPDLQLDGEGPATPTPPGFAGLLGQLRERTVRHM